MEFNGENALESGGEGSRTIDATIVVATLPSGCRCCRRHLSLGHVVSIHLLTIDEGDNAEAIIQSDFEGSHVVQTCEGFAQIVSSSELVCGGSQSVWKEASAKLASFQTLSADELSFHSASLLMGA